MLIWLICTSLASYQRGFYSGVSWNASMYGVTPNLPLSVTLPRGLYKLEAWGARGGRGLKDGNNAGYGGKGAYASAVMRVRGESVVLYLYPGEHGTDSDRNSHDHGKSAWNGGGRGGYDNRGNPDTGGGGGGATDIRLVDGSWSSQDSLRSRILIAGGGSGAVENANGAPGGSYNCLKMKDNTTPVEVDCSKTSTAVGANGEYSNGYPATGGGGGYYTGVSGESQGQGGPAFKAVAASGSSYAYGVFEPPAQSFGTNPKEYVKNANIEITNGILKSGNEKWVDLDGKEKDANNDNGWIRITEFMYNEECTNGNVKVIRKKNHGLFFSLISMFGN